MTIIRLSLMTGLLVLAACQSTEIRAKCAGTADPASCERAEYEQLREIERQREAERPSGGGGGY